MPIEAYMVRALLAALLLGPLCALLGVFVTARRMSFFSETIAHGSLLGLAVGFWLGLADATIPILAVGLLVAMALMWLKEKSEMPLDTLMALLLSGSVSLGVILLSVQRASRADIHRILFGDILAVGTNDLMLAGLLFGLSFLGIFLRLNQLTLLTLQEELAHVSGISVKAWNYLFVVVLTLTVALSVRLLGIILVTSLLVVPPAAARNVSRSLRAQILGSVLAGAFAGLTGVLVSYRFDLPCGPSIVLAAVALFMVTLVMSRLRTRA